MDSKYLAGFVPGSEGDGTITYKNGFALIRVNGLDVPVPIAGAAWGTITALDSLAASNQSIVEIGLSTVWNMIQAALTAHNAQLADMSGALVETTTDRRRRYGGNDAMVMDDLDEFGRADAQKITAGADVDFPLQKVGGSLQWTADSLEVITGDQMRANVTQLFDADILAYLRNVKRAIFRAANYSTVDRLVDGTTLNVKRLVNADGAPIPLGPQGEAFDGATHTHYLATAALIAANVDSLVLAVVEHNPSGVARIYINRAQEVALKALAGFTPYLDARIVNQTAGQVARDNLTSMDLNNREIGIWTSGGVTAVVAVKPWIPANYLFAWIDGGPRPIVRRIRNANRANLRLVAENPGTEMHPFHARSYEREHGFGIYNRVNGAVLYTGGGAYTDPVLN